MLMRCGEKLNLPGMGAMRCGEKTRLLFSRLVGTVFNCAYVVRLETAPTGHGGDAVRLETEPTGGHMSPRWG